MVKYFIKPQFSAAFSLGGAVIEGFRNIWNNLDWSRLIDLLLPVIPAVICFSIHELSHGLMALCLGDNTAKRQGRLTLNPLKHIDPIGFIMLVVLGFGWAKPVNVDMRRFRNPKLGMAATAFAGPGANILLAVVLMPLYGLFVAQGGHMNQTVYHYGAQLLVTTMYLSLSLAVFNLFPIPPLDGSKIVEAVLPQRIYWQIMRYERYGMILLFIAVWTGILSKPMGAVVDWGFDRLLNLAQWTFELAVKFI